MAEENTSQIILEGHVIGLKMWGHKQKCWTMSNLNKRQSELITKDKMIFIHIRS